MVLRQTTSLQIDKKDNLRLFLEKVNNRPLEVVRFFPNRSPRGT